MTKINIYDDLINQPNEKIEAIKKILPDCFDIDGNLLAEKLQEVLSNNFAKPTTERFTFNWAGKQQARELAYATYVDGTLKFDTTKSKNFATTKNLIIEGDNLQVLKLLKKSYKNMVKCIYIDPPYNTGNEFVYNDKFELDINKYLTATGEIDADTGEQLADYIKKDDGKKNSKWLSFMYPRLMAARELLREDGVIFISIDDHEMHNLRHLMNEIFGEREFVASFVWNSSTGGGIRSKYVNKNHEYCLCYSKNQIELPMLFSPLSDEAISQYNRSDEHGIYREKDFAWKTDSKNKNQKYGIKAPDGRLLFPKTGYSYRFVEETFLEALKNNQVVFKETKTSPLVYENQEKAKHNIYIKKYLGDGTGAPTSLLSKSHVGISNIGSEEIKKLFNDLIFNNPKSTKYIKHLLQISTKPGDLVLDFFAGSGTTGQAVMELNYEEVNKRNQDDFFNTPHPNPLPQGERELADDFFNTPHPNPLPQGERELTGRRFILVQLPEKIDNKKEAFKAGYHKISDITVERVKRASEKYQGIDNGFKVLQLTNNPQKEGLLSLGRYDDNQFIIAHLALMYGYGLNYQATKIAEKEIYLLKSEIANTKDAIIILEKQLLTMPDIMNLVLQFGKGHYKFFTKECALNIELTYNLLQHFGEEQIVTI